MAARSPLACVTCRSDSGLFAGCLLPLISLLAACHSTGPATAGPDGVPSIAPAVETEPVRRIGDVADDPVIIVPEDTTNTWIVGTDKKSGLRIYDLSGKALHVLKTGRLNNVDALRGGDDEFIVAASNRTTPAIDLYLANPSRNAIVLANRVPLEFDEPYGLCMARLDGNAYVFVGDKTGQIQRWSIDEDLLGTLEETYSFASQTEGCVVDPATRTLYVGEEAKGIWSLDLTDGKTTLLDAIGTGRLVADVEGLDIYDNGKARYLVASSQGDDSYVVYDLADDSPLLKFRISENTELGIDGTSDTDGLAVTTQALPGFPKGILVVQDGYNIALFRNQNFKIIDWRDIAARITSAEQNLRESP